METPGLMSSSPTITAFAPGRTARHEAAFTWVLDCVLGLTWAWADTEEEYRQAEGVRFHYGGPASLPGVAFAAEGLLSELGQCRSEPPDVEGEGADLFAAVFWMGSRMEEFLPDVRRDTHDRYDPTGSVSEQRGWIDRPMCEHWSFAIGARLLGPDWPAHEAALTSSFEVVPTLDVDSAFAFRGKGMWRTGGALCRDVITGRFQHAARRIRVIRGREHDPYDTYDVAIQLHRERGLRARWFFLLAAFGPHDKGLPSSSAQLATLMQRLDQDEGQTVHWHPGHAAAEDVDAMAHEYAAFERILGRPASASRQHYLRLIPTSTRRALLALGVREDHTEGHAIRTGFRGGFARSRPWYDLEAETLTPLMLHPFAAMDATFLRYMGTAPEDVPREVEKLAEEVRAVGGPLRLLWHNESLAAEGQWAGWSDVYPAVLDAAIGERAG